jgi:hypothetical protein
MEVGNFGRLGRSKIFGSQGSLQIWRVRGVKKFGRSEGLERLGGRKDWQDPLAANECTIATSCTLCKLSFR